MPDAEVVGDERQDRDRDRQVARDGVRATHWRAAQVLPYAAELARVGSGEEQHPFLGVAAPRGHEAEERSVGAGPIVVVAGEVPLEEGRDLRVAEVGGEAHVGAVVEEVERLALIPAARGDREVLLSSLFSGAKYTAASDAGELVRQRPHALSSATTTPLGSTSLTSCMREKRDNMSLSVL